MLTQEWRLMAAAQLGGRTGDQCRTSSDQSGSTKPHKPRAIPTNLSNLQNRDRRQFAARIEVMQAFELKKNATTREAQEKVGYTQLQWDRFYYITKAEIDTLVKANPGIKWSEVKANDVEEMHSRVNAQLQAEHIPEVRYDVFRWRMARAIQNQRPNASNKGGAKAAKTAAAAPDKDAEQD
ncbi:hypothetical protein J3E72DRAFT_401031 [Bipolaris maydis]|uniref:uncharacterized protein n=1 Tax=Cochliobolus heterostrophus TaxID=5016 RepID=UPI0003267F6E|nr:hypothetical protein J3E73DRAFT_385618 [Bipolaris maydis]KAJ5035193.1 hypothetical protein J3E74DRAFT_423714 [Bipolaris maydis]KAJ5055064.1 hypothetical protein J3E74DRAFT_422419 [Bipolaris maydis]KAJ6202937.1 hypothetical protein J3E72DRAFT_401031 [Bipolaris maydis]KAJ6275471.1 hypothetical protein PSV08DRAFT_357768 [Bipolaris maydis]